MRRRASVGLRRRHGIGIQRPGSNAQYTAVPVANTAELPAATPFDHAAALAASGPLAWEELDVARVGSGDWVLVPGAAGSVGVLLVSLALRRGARVVAATRGRRAAGELLALGADAVVDTRDPDLADRLRSLAPRGVDVVVDNVTDPDLWRRYWPAVARRGRIVTAGRAGGHGEPLPVDVVSFYNRRASLTGLVVGDPRPVDAFWAAQHREPLTIPPELVTVFPLERAADAHRLVEAGTKVGHVVLSVDGNAPSEEEG
ncbi:zinc-binding alcohol dehydrogenase family protein [Umezawaea endophytica]|uniref:Zinc-binding alcohol dehydrogenase family protein n=1 Tax=Umezawaea endophytica TaxID=1654476 RepID=A0A9X2VGT8_9PSEU|nr:zinc-binding alcohol dehydrogenase family protein [Umezawaea endophytica]MCS7475884.1 zinc-binding alcohol dehydrogenase family protein [Umezawaea endophytica]